MPHRFSITNLKCVQRIKDFQETDVNPFSNHQDLEGSIMRVMSQTCRISRIVLSLGYSRYFPPVTTYLCFCFAKS